MNQAASGWPAGSVLFLNFTSHSPDHNKDWRLASNEIQIFVCCLAWPGLVWSGLEETKENVRLPELINSSVETRLDPILDRSEPHSLTDHFHTVVLVLKTPYDLFLI